MEAVKIRTPASNLSVDAILVSERGGCVEHEGDNAYRLPYICRTFGLSGRVFGFSSSCPSPRIATNG